MSRVSFFESLFRHVRFERSRIDHRWDGWEDWEKSLEDEHPGTRESCPECKKSGKVHSFYNVLRPIRLVESTDFLSYNRSREVFELRRLDAGEVVLVDADGIVRYKVSCGNRLVIPVQSKPTVTATMDEAGEIPYPCPPVVAPTFFSNLGFWGWLGMVVLGLTLVLLVLGALVMLALVLGWLLDNHRPAPRPMRYGWCYRCEQHHWFRKG